MRTRFFSLVFFVLSKLPLPLLQRLGALAARLAYRFAKRFRARMDAHLQLSGLPLDKSEVLHHSGAQVFEWPYIWTRSAGQVRALVQLEGFAAFEAAKAEGRGIIILSPHLGCFEVLGQYIAENTEFTAMYRPHTDPVMNALIDRARTPHYKQLAPASLAGVRQLVKALRRNEAVGILPDHVPADGVWAPFYGKAAYTGVLPAKLLQLSNAAVLLAYAERRAGGQGFVLHFERLDPALLAAFGSKDELEQATAINQAMEHLIAKQPEQYFWAYDRWRKK